MADEDASNGPRTIDAIEVALKARAKTGRYLGAATLRERLRILDGMLYRKPDGDYYLETTVPTDGNEVQTVVIIFVVEGNTATIVSQTSPHYDWTTFEQLHNAESQFQFVE